MKIFLLLFFLSILSPPLHAEQVAPFKASCVEGETHRFDGGNGKDMMGETIKDPEFGWMTEKWGGLTLSWSGDKTIIIGTLNATVLSTENGVLSAVWAGNAPAVNIYSMVLDTVIGEAVYSQVQASSIGKNRAIKVRSQNLKCKIEWLN
ncbi:hypothetical protein KAR10_03750 [bacterium]|nr:hypothetical protein [bacterium]